MRELKILLALGKKGALNRNVTVTTQGLGKELNIPQQTVSRLLIKLTKSNLITREKGIKGYLVGITPKGKELLQSIDFDLEAIFSPTKELVMKGKVTDGLKDGKYYMGFNEYRKKIKAKLGFEPYQGTLNLKLNTQEDRVTKEKLRRIEGIEIEGFKRGNKIFGSIKCFECKINEINACIIIPERSHYGLDILELIAPFKLRNKLGLKNWDEVVVKVG